MQLYKSGIRAGLQRVIPADGTAMRGESISVQEFEAIRYYIKEALKLDLPIHRMQQTALNARHESVVHTYHGVIFDQGFSPTSVGDFDDYNQAEMHHAFLQHPAGSGGKKKRRPKAERRHPSNL